MSPALLVDLRELILAASACMYSVTSEVRSLLPGFETNVRVLGESEVLENPSFLPALVVALKSREVLESLD